MFFLVETYLACSQIYTYTAKAFYVFKSEIQTTKETGKLDAETIHRRRWDPTAKPRLPELGPWGPSVDSSQMPGAGNGLGQSSDTGCNFCKHH